jgi:activating signal cointegrator 1
MKALTVWQPWASLIASGEKQYETRGWETKYRGPLAIHAGLGDMTKELYECNSFYRDALRGSSAPALPSGAVLCIVNLVECLPVDSLSLSQKELAFGDYSSGRFAWKLEVVERFEKPIPASGKHGLWDWTVRP